MTRHPYITAVLLAAFLPQAARAELIGVGLDWRRGIFVQEYWHKGEPHYLLANHSKEDVEITVHEFDSKWRLGQPLPKPQAGPWKVPAGQQTLVAAKGLVGEKLYRFVMGGKDPLGVLSSPQNPGYKGPGYATGLGLSGSGGMTKGLYLVQDKLESTAGDTIKVVLHLPAKSGVLKFNRMPDRVADPLRPITIVPDSATSKTLPVTSDDKQIVIDTEAAKADAKSHEVELTLTLPKIESARLFMLDGWLAKGTGGSGVTRGLWVEGE